MATTGQGDERDVDDTARSGTRGRAHHWSRCLPTERKKPLVSREVQPSAAHDIDQAIAQGGQWSGGWGWGAGGWGGSGGWAGWADWGGGGWNGGGCAEAAEEDEENAEAEAAAAAAAAADAEVEDDDARHRRLLREEAAPEAETWRATGWRGGGGGGGGRWGRSGWWEATAEAEPAGRADGRRAAGRLPAWVAEGRRSGGGRRPEAGPCTACGPAGGRWRVQWAAPERRAQGPHRRRGQRVRQGAA